MKFLRNLLVIVSKAPEIITEFWHDSHNEFVEIGNSELNGYYEYDARNPHRFDVKYDGNLNRIWHKES